MLAGFMNDIGLLNRFEAIATKDSINYLPTVKRSGTTLTFNRTGGVKSTFSDRFCTAREGLNPRVSTDL